MAAKTLSLTHTPPRFRRSAFCSTRAGCFRLKAQVPACGRRPAAHRAGAQGGAAGDADAALREVAGPRDEGPFSFCPRELKLLLWCILPAERTEVKLVSLTPGEASYPSSLRWVKLQPVDSVVVRLFLPGFRLTLPEWL